MQTGFVSPYQDVGQLAAQQDGGPSSAYPRSNSRRKSFKESRSNSQRGTHALGQDTRIHGRQANPTGSSVDSF